METYQNKFNYEWLLTKLDSSDIVENLLIFIYDWYLGDNDLDVVDIEVVKNYFKTNNRKEILLNNQDIYIKYFWITANIREIDCFLLNPSEHKNLAMSFIEEIILEYIDWKENNRDFNKLWILVRQKYNNMYNENYQKGEYEIRNWGMNILDDYLLGGLIEIIK